MSELPPDLAELAAAHGVATDYWDWQGQHVQVSVETVRTVLRALGVDASTPEAVWAALDTHRNARWRQMLEPCIVTRPGWTTAFWVHLRHGAQVEVWVELEQGGERRDLVQLDRWVPPAEIDGGLVGEATFQLPADLPLGYHHLHARSEDRAASSLLVVTPQWVGLPPTVGERAWGFMTQLYSVRSRRSWGLGDLADLADLAAWSGGELGAGFVLVNPLHAAEPVAPMEPSPYLPATRRFVNPVYARVEAVPEFAYLSAADRAAVERIAGVQRRRNTSDERLDRNAVWKAKRVALEAVHKVPLSPGRRVAYEGFVRREGQGLTDFATWSAFTEAHGLDRSQWPAGLDGPHSPAVDAERERLADRVDFYCWLQWVLDEQLEAAQRAATSAGMRVGIVHDLAVGVHPGGADSWALQDVLAQGVTVGAPADAFNQLGQDWSQPPWHPQRLAEAGYAPYRDMLRTVLRHAGGIRIDHVIGLFRLWWVPQGMAPRDGTYVRYDYEALIGILALEAHRAGAFVVGEDLGTVEPWMRDYLASRGLLGTSILWFERDWQHGGRPLQPQEWRELCLATVTTHDLPPTAGYLVGEHIRIRADLGLLTRSVEEERAVDLAEQEEWMGVLGGLGLLRNGAGEQEKVEALHRYLTLTPSRLLGVALPDAVGDRRAMNQPGTNNEYPNWRLPLADESGEPVLLEDLAVSPRARALARAIAGAPQQAG